MLFFLTMMFDATVTNATTEIELTGINIAAIIGDKLPVTAKDNPIIL